MPACCPLSRWREAMEPSFNGSGRHSPAVQQFLIALQPALATSASHARFKVSATPMAAATPALSQEANNKGTKLAMSMRLRTSSCGHGTLDICFVCWVSNPGLPQAARRTRPSPTSPLTVRMSHCRHRPRRQRRPGVDRPRQCPAWPNPYHLRLRHRVLCRSNFRR